MTAVTYHFDYGPTTAYGSSTPSTDGSVPPGGLAVNAPLTGLEPFTTYHYRLVASDCTAASCQSVSSDQSFTTGLPVAPAENVSIGVAPVSGHIKIRLKGKHRFTILPAGAAIPVGATIDATHGTVELESVIGPGEVASGRFSSGIFTIAQPTGGTVTVLGLVSSFAACRRAAPLARAATVAATTNKRRPTSHKTVNQVFGTAHGQFSTRGHYATAADEGTGWRTADRCDGTLIAVSAGMVTVTDRVHHRTFVLTAGHRYLAKHR